MPNTGKKKIIVGVFAFSALLFFGIYVIDAVETWDKAVAAPLISQIIHYAVLIIGFTMGANVAEWGFKMWKNGGNK